MAAARYVVSCSLTITNDLIPAVFVDMVARLSRSLISSVHNKFSSAYVICYKSSVRCVISIKLFAVFFIFLSDAGVVSESQ